jgi:hypothetical protein
MSYAMVALFGGAFLPAAAFALINNALEARLDSHAFLRCQQRPRMQLSHLMATWRPVLQLISLLAIVTAEARPGQAYPMSVRLDEQGDITQLQYEGSRVGTVCFSIADLSRGAVIMNTDSRDIIRLRVGSEFSAKDGGRVTLSYLKNGVSGRYENFTMELVRSGSWHLEENSRTFNRLYFENHHGIFGMVIGVKRPVATFLPN